MRRLVFEERVDLDLELIRVYIEEDSPVNALRFVERLEDHCRILARTPYIGRARDEIAAGLRSINFGRYVILYRVSPDEVLVVAVIHGARDIGRAFREE